MGPRPQIRKILFTTDLSNQTADAFRYAVGLSVQFDASIVTLYVMEEAPQVHNQDFVDFLGKDRWAEIRQAQEQEIRQALIGKRREGQMIRQALSEMLAAAQRELKADLPRSDEVVVTQGDVVDCILQEIRTHAIDLVVMGYHPRGRIEETLTGSVTRSILRNVQVPVLLVRLS
jgi:nucleotide-binding universal stress UspA family protein